MIPQPKSEAWFICALKNQPYQACEGLEDRSGNDNSPNSLKKELAELRGGTLPIREELNELVSQRQFDIDQLLLPSFLAFRRDLEAVLDAAH